MASHEVAPPAWRYVAAKKLLRAGIDTTFLGASACDRLLRVEAKNDITALIQSLIAIDFAKTYYTNQAMAKSTGMELGGTERGVRWLLEWGLFRRLTLASKQAMGFYLLTKVISDLCDVVRTEPLRDAFGQLQTFLVDARRVVPSPRDYKDFLSRLVVHTLSKMDQFTSWVTFWSYTLLPLADIQAIGADSFDDQAGLLIHGLFANHVDFTELEKLLPRKTFTLAHVDAALGAKSTWSLSLVASPHSRCYY
jgi:hypothetical protein